ncbi:MAG: ATP-binding cassette domain-containing protein [Spirochaetaceae bacterium]|nr:MAG: ATP-binding cassette domain-containing protein [Spirochaetaceae bacterium]
MTDRADTAKGKKIALYGLGALLLLVLWSTASFLAGSYIIPSPFHTAVELISLLSQGYAWTQILISFLRVVAGFTLALVAGLSVGIASGINRDIETLFRPLVLIAQGTPPLLWIIPLILVLGIGHLSPITVIALICFPTVALNVNEGVKTVPVELKQMLDLFAPGAYPRVRELLLPHLKPFLAASVRLGIVLGIKASVIAEYFGANNGIGFQVQAAFHSLQVRKLFAWGVIFILLILITGWLLGKLEKALAHPGKQQQRALTSLLAPRIGGKLTRATPKPSEREQLVLRDVSFAYPGAQLLLDRIDLTVRQEEIVVISGDSGVGKTTLLYAAAGLLQPVSGTVMRPERIGFIFQDERFLPWRSNLWNVALPLIYAGIPPAVALGQARRLFAEAGLSGWEQAAPAELSGGMKKRLAFARCFARLPDALLLDEPFSGLDAGGRQCLWRKFITLLDVHHGPVLIVTHFPEEIPSSDRCRFFTLAPSRAGVKRPNRLIPCHSLLTLTFASNTHTLGGT